MSLTNQNILPFGDGRHSSTCQIHCFKSGSQGGSEFSGQNLPDGSKCHVKGDHNDDHYCISGRCQKFDCHSSGTYLLDRSRCQKRSQRQVPNWSSWKVMTSCSGSCLAPVGSGIRLVTRQCLNADQGSKCSGVKHSVQLCQSRNFQCSILESGSQYATKVCTRYQVKFANILQFHYRYLIIKT